MECDKANNANKFSDAPLENRREKKSQILLRVKKNVTLIEKRVICRQPSIGVDNR